MRKILILLPLLFFLRGAAADSLVINDSLLPAGPATGLASDSVKPKPVRKKWVAALLAFPVTGITGIHRVYLGTEPWMPLVYLGTLGGFGILPLIDFFVILFTPKEKLDKYFDDPKVFMWGE